MDSHDSKKAHEKFDNVQDMFRDAEDTFKKGVGTLNEWTDQARHLIENKPGVLLAAVGISGFITGALLRHGLSARREAHGEEAAQLPMEPILLFAAGIFAGVTAGPKIIQEAASGLSRAAGGHPDNISRMDGTRLYSEPPMNEKPFEKF